MKEFLISSPYIDCDHPAIRQLAAQLATGVQSERELAQRTFAWVRDRIKHCLDCHTSALPLKASDVLAAGTGFCYAKSHLLAALLRANRIPAGLSYQRLSLSGSGAPYCLHGLNAVYLTEYGWYRVDPRGNRSDIDAQFCPPTERLAFALHDSHEFEVPGIFAAPLPLVVNTLKRYRKVEDALPHLPDIAALSLCPQPSLSIL